MGGFVRGDVVALSMPSLDPDQARKRPALVLAALEGSELILCQITGSKVHDRYAVPLLEVDFEAGSLKAQCNIRPNRVFVADRDLIVYRVGRLVRSKIDQIAARVGTILKGNGGLAETGETEEIAPSGGR